MPESEARESARSSSLARSLAIALVVLAAAWILAGFFVVPQVVESQLVAFVEEEIGVRPEIGQVKFDPFGFALTLEDVAIPDPEDASVSAVRFQSLSVDVGILRSLTGQVSLEDVALVDPEIFAVVDASGRLNLLGLLPEEDPEAPAEADPDEEGITVDVGHVRIEEGRLHFEDRSQSPPFEADLTPLDLDLQGFTTRSGGDQSPLSITMQLGDQGRLDWQGSFGFEPLRSEGSLALGDLDLRVPWDFLSDRLRFEVEQGRLGFDLDYALSRSEAGKLAIQLSAGKLGVDGLVIRDPEAGDTPAGSALALPALRLAPITADWMDGSLRTLSIETVSVEGGHVRSHLDRESGLRLIELFTPVADAAPQGQGAPGAGETEPAADASALALQVDRVAFSDFEIALEDRGAATPVAYQLAPLSLEIEGYTSAPGTSLTVDLRTGFGESGKLSVSGPVDLDPPAVRLDVEAEAIALGPFQPYVDSVVHVDVPSGELDAALAVDWKANAAGLDLGAKGRVQLDDLRAIDRRLKKPFLELRQLRVEELDYASATAANAAGDRIKIAEVALDRAMTHIILAADGRTNLDAILGGSEAEAKGGASGASGEEASGSAAKVEIGKLSLDGVGADFDDLTQSPHFVISLDDLTGAIAGLSSDAGARAQVELAGRIDDTAPIRVTGDINPLSSEAYTDIAIQVDGVSLPAFSPYSGRYVGRGIERGKLDLDLDYKLNARHLEASNLIELEQFAFGGRVESKDATSLPIPLALAVLRDPKGNIRIPLPIEGDLDDPSFSVLRLVGQALVNLITRVATSPFAVVAGLVEGGGEGLGEIGFAPGSARLSEFEASELARIAPALVQRPKLRVEIRGRADPAVDEAGLQREQIESALRRDAFEKLSRAERERLGEPRAVELSPEARQAGLDRLVRERLGGVVPAAPDPAGEGTGAATAETRSPALEALAAQVEIADTDLRKLARERAAAVQRALVGASEIAPERVYLVGVEIGAVAADDEVATLLELTVD